MLMKGAIGFCRKKGTIAGAMRAFTNRSWDAVFVILQMSPEIMVIEASRGWIERCPITRYESLKYTVTFFFPDGVAIASIDEAIKVAQNFPNGDATKDVMADLIIYYLRTIDPQGPWVGVRTTDEVLDAIHSILKSHPWFHAVTSS